MPSHNLMAAPVIDEQRLRSEELRGRSPRASLTSHTVSIIPEFKLVFSQALWSFTEAVYVQGSPCNQLALLL